MVMVVIIMVQYFIIHPSIIFSSSLTVILKSYVTSFSLFLFLAHRRCLLLFLSSSIAFRPVSSSLCSTTFSSSLIIYLLLSVYSFSSPSFFYDFASSIPHVVHPLIPFCTFPFLLFPFHRFPSFLSLSLPSTSIRLPSHSFPFLPSAIPFAFSPILFLSFLFLSHSSLRSFSTSTLCCCTRRVMRLSPSTPSPPPSPLHSISLRQKQKQ